MEPFTPAKARVRLPKDIEDPQWIAEPKLDGSRYLMYVGFDPYERHEGTTLLSRRLSSKDGMYVDKSRNVPHLLHFPASLKGFNVVLDGEIKAPGPFSNTVSVMGSLPDASHAIQATLGKVKYHVFDVLSIGKPDAQVLTEFSFRMRRIILQGIVEKMDNPYIVLVPQVTIGKGDFYEQIVYGGGEGIILKDLEAPYGKGWAKMKKRPDMSVVIMDMIPGEGKYLNQIGALLFGVWINGVLTEIGSCSGFDDDLRQKLSADFPNCIGKVMDVHYQEWTSGNRLRHPSFFRFRDDVAPESLIYVKSMNFGLVLEQS